MSEGMNGAFAELFNEQLEPFYLAGRVFKIENVYDAFGEIVQTELAYDCKMQINNLDEAMRLAQGSADTDRRILVLQASTDAVIDTDCELICDEGFYAGYRYQVASVNIDPVAARYSCRGRRAS